MSFKASGELEVVLRKGRVEREASSVEISKVER